MFRILILTDMENLALSVLRVLGNRGSRVAVAGGGYLLRSSRHCALFSSVAADGRAMAEAGGPVLEAVERVLRGFKPEMIVSVDVAGAYLAANLKEKITGIPFYPSPDPAALAVMDNKWTFHEFLLKHGLPSPQTRRLESAAVAASLPVPVVIKPLADSGGRGVKVVRTREYLSERLKGAVFPLLAQEYIEGEDVDLSFLADHGRLLAWAVQVRSPGGVIRYIDDERAVDIGRRVAEASSYTGLAHIDMRYAGPARESIQVIECNPRFWGTYKYTLGLGISYFERGLALLEGLEALPFERAPTALVPGLAVTVKSMMRGRLKLPAPSRAYLRQKLGDPAPEFYYGMTKLFGFGGGPDPV